MLDTTSAAIAREVRSLVPDEGSDQGSSLTNTDLPFPVTKAHGMGRDPKDRKDSKDGKDGKRMPD